MEIKLPDFAVKEIKNRIKAFRKESFDEETGELKATLYYDFFVREIAPFIYNQAVRDAAAFMQDKAMIMEQDFFVPERDGRG